MGFLSDSFYATFIQRTVRSVACTRRVRSLEDCDESARGVGLASTPATGAARGGGEEDLEAGSLTCCIVLSFARCLAPRRVMAPGWPTTPPRSSNAPRRHAPAIRRWSQPQHSRAIPCPTGSLFAQLGRAMRSGAPDGAPPPHTPFNRVDTPKCQLMGQTPRRCSTVAANPAPPRSAPADDGPSHSP